MEAPQQGRRSSSSRDCCTCCSCGNCSAVVLCVFASVLVVGGIFLAFHYWDYKWLVVTAIGAVLVLIGAAAPFCKQHDRRRSRIQKNASRATNGHRQREEEPLPSAPPLSSVFSVSQMSLNMMPPFYGSGDDTSRDNTGVALNHIVNIDGQSYLLLPIVSPTSGNNTSNCAEASRRFSTALTSLSGQALQVDLPAKRDCQLQTEPPQTPTPVVQDLLLQTHEERQSTAPAEANTTEPARLTQTTTTIDLTATPSASSRISADSQVPLIRLESVVSDGDTDSSAREVTSENIPTTSAGDCWIETGGSDVEDSQSLVEAVPPPSYEEVTKDTTVRDVAVTVSAIPSYETL
ncbi:uncharacterized protein LOC135388901 [Ornithodoros turicata]|uniref:uncharacterized protein LOC135388901 n=1 Tax=Ornithodoros turicata TaxID=34597 RepID=UPI003138955D